MISFHNRRRFLIFINAGNRINRLGPVYNYSEIHKGAVYADISFYILYANSKPLHTKNDSERTSRSPVKIHLKKKMHVQANAKNRKYNKGVNFVNHDRIFETRIRNTILFDSRRF